MAKHPWMKFYPADWLADQRVALMTPAQKGVYIDLLCLAWTEGSIPSETMALARLLRVHWRTLEPLLGGVLKHFSPTSDPSRLTQRRLEKERKDASERGEKSRKAANQRWLTDASALHVGNGIQKENQKERSEAEVESRSRKKREREKKPATPAALAVLEYLNLVRQKAIKGARTIGANSESLEHIEARLSSGYTVEDCKHVIDVCSAEVRQKPDTAKWFNTVSPFRPDGFARKLGSDPLGSVDGRLQVMDRESEDVIRRLF